MKLWITKEYMPPRTTVLPHEAEWVDYEVGIDRFLKKQCFIIAALLEDKHIPFTSDKNKRLILNDAKICIKCHAQNQLRRCPSCKHFICFNCT